MDMHVIDCDGHVAEPWEMYREYIDPEFRDRVPRRVDVEGHRWVIVDDKVYPNFVRYAEKPLGVLNGTGPLPRPVQRPELAEGGADPHRRLQDMDKEGVAAAVLFPSGVPSMCAVPDPELEAALYRAYHRWLADYCSADPGRLKGVAVVCMRDVERGVEELRRTVGEAWMVGAMVSPHVDDLNLDSPSFDPFWAAAQDLDIPICIHAGSGRPPYALGTDESSDNFFLMHAMAHPFEQMRAVAACMGGGVFDRFPRLRIAFLEAGVGWVPWWLDRLQEHAEGLPNHVPEMKREPMEYVADGQAWFSCEPDEPMLPAALAQLGDDAVMFPSDYPHWDCGFPDSVNKIVARSDILESSKEKMLSTNSLRFYPRLG